MPGRLILLPVQSNGRWGLIDSNGAIVVSIDYDFAVGGNGYGYVLESDRLVLFDESGKTVLARDGITSYSEVREGLVAVESLEGSTYLRLDGTILNGRFDTCRDFSGGFASVEINGYWGIIDRNGGWVVPPSFDAALDYDPVSRTVPIRERDAWQLLNEDGTKVDLNAADLRPPKSGVYGAAVERHKEVVYGLITATGEWCVRPRFSDMALLAIDNVAVRDHSGWRLISLDGETIFTTPATALGSSFSGFARAYFGGKFEDGGLAGGKFWFLDRAGCPQFSKCYDHAEDFSDGIAEVGTRVAGDEFAIGYLDLSGREIWTPSI